MASIIKNQILKHLSKFTKNLSPDKINLSTLKGEGELSNLELDEVILMDLLELPTWMKLTKAMCNKVSIKIQWTRLKSQPICLYLDEVVLEIETCEEPRPPNNANNQSSYRSEGKYGFVDKVIDGIYVHINAVSVTFLSQKFLGTLQLSRVVVQSMSPLWANVTDIRQARIRDPDRDAILLFKEVDWQTTRIEANAREEEDGIPSTPLRLIANQSKIRITLKKRLSDCSIISSRVMLLLDDLLWVLTDTQLKAAIMYANSLRQMIQKSAEQSKKLAAVKLQKQGHISAGSADQLLLQQQQQQQQRARNPTTESKMFTRFDVITTSYHLVTGRIDLHLCDDSPPDRESSPKHNKQIDGGAMQIVFSKLSLDVYPFHPAGGERKQWYRYTDNQGSRNNWVQKLFESFREEVKKARDTCSVASPTQSPSHLPADLRSPSRQPPPGNRAPPRPPQPGNSGVRGQAGSPSPRPRVTKLLESCFVLRLEEFIIYRVSTADNQRSTPQKFFCSDKKALHLPSDMSVFHLEYTDYFFTDGLDYPVPPPNLYVLVNPVRLTLDYLTVLWANYFSLNLAQTVENHIITEPQSDFVHVDIKLEALMPRLVIPAEEKVDNQPDRPDSIQLQMSKVTATNTHVEDGFTYTDLETILDHYRRSSNLFTRAEITDGEMKMAAIPEHFQKMANGELNPFLHQYAKQLIVGELPEEFIAEDVGTDFIKKLLHMNTLKRDSRFDMWGVRIDQLWVEFLGVPTNKTRPFPFVESFPLTLWLAQPSLIPGEQEEEASYRSHSSSQLPGTGSSSSTGNLVNGHVTPGDQQAPGGGLASESQRPSKQRLKEFYSSLDDTSECGEDSGDVRTGTPQADNCDNSSAQAGDDVQCVVGKVADMNVVAKIGSKLRIQLNHYQYLFLMRLVDSLTNFQLALNADIENFVRSVKSDAVSETFSLPLLIPELEFAMVCPYIAELLPLTDNSGVLCSPLTESSDGRDGYTDTDTDYIVEKSESSSGREDSEQVITVTQTDQGPVVEMTNALYPESHLIKSQSDSGLVCHLPGIVTVEMEDGQQKIIRRDSHSTEELSSHPADGVSAMGQSSSYNASDSGIGSLASSGQRSRSQSKVSNQVKKSFTSAVSNISSFADKLKNKLDIDDDDSDRLSIKTDMSDDDDFELLSLDENEMPAFSNTVHMETASSTGTDVMDDLSSVFADTNSASKARELVSVVLFRLTGIELLLQSRGEDMVARIQAKKLDSEEPGNIIYEDFYSKFSNVKGFLKVPAEIEDANKFPIQFKFISGPSVRQVLPNAADQSFMDVQVFGHELGLKMSSITSLANFVEDEKIGVPTPMHVDVNGLHLMLQEDRPPVNMTSPGNVPMALNIHKLTIRRYEDGVFHLTTDGMPPVSVETLKAVDSKLATVIPSTQSASRVASEQQEVLPRQLSNGYQQEVGVGDRLAGVELENRNLRAENEALKEQLRRFGSSEVSTGEVRKKLEKENSVLIERVVAQDDELVNYKQEQESLISTIKLLQDELTQSENRYLGRGPNS